MRTAESLSTSHIHRCSLGTIFCPSTTSFTKQGGLGPLGPNKASGAPQTRTVPGSHGWHRGRQHRRAPRLPRKGYTTPGPPRPSWLCAPSLLMLLPTHPRLCSPLAPPFRPPFLLLPPCHLLLSLPPSLSCTLLLPRAPALVPAAPPCSSPPPVSPSTSSPPHTALGTVGFP